MTRLRNFMSDWHFWVAVAYFGITLTVVGLVILFNRSGREQAARTASTKAASVTQVSQCFTNVKNAPVVKGFIAAQELIIENNILTNEQAVAASRPDDPLLPVRLAAIARMTAARENNRALRQLIQKATPNIQGCVKLAHQLGVDPSRFTPRKAN